MRVNLKQQKRSKNKADRHCGKLRLGEGLRKNTLLPNRTVLVQCGRQ